MATTVELRMARARLEDELDQLRSQLGDLEERLHQLRAAERRGRITPGVLERHEGAVVELRREIQRRKIALANVAEQIATSEAVQQQSLVAQLQQENEIAKGELDQLRRELCSALRGLSELLRRHQRVAAEKQRLSAELTKLTGRDYSYENYIACALLHQLDYTGEVRFVLEALKKSRPVA